jgi:hypothetical protein
MDAISLTKSVRSDNYPESAVPIGSANAFDEYLETGQVGRPAPADGQPNHGKKTMGLFTGPPLPDDAPPAYRPH